jgi:hypothetical protein
MKRFATAGAMVALLLVLFAPAAMAADGRWDEGEILVAVNGPVNVPPGDRLDTLVVFDGDARISGEIETIVIAGGSATLSGATTENLVVLDASVELAAGTTVLGDVRTLNGTVTQQPGSDVQGAVSSLETELGALALLLIPAMILLFIGLGLVAVFAALGMAAFAARQTREVESLISAEPGKVLVTGIAGFVAVPLAAILLMVTVVGAPIGFLVLFALLPVAAFLSWIVAAIWVGDWLVARMRGSRETDRPYLAAVVGVLALAVAGILPFVTGIATLFGFGALLLAAWRTLRRQRPPVGDAPAVQAAPSAS